MDTQAKSLSKKLMKASIMIVGAVMTMGNQKCEQKEVEKPRTLKKLVELGSLQASPIMTSATTGFDFKFVANQQIYEVMMKSGDFALKYNPKIAVPPAKATDTNFFNLTSADGKMMKSMATKANKTDYASVYSQTAWCMVDKPQVVVSGSVNSFQVKGGGGVQLGYSPQGSVVPSIGGSAGFSMESADLDITMNAARPLFGSSETSRLLASANVSSTQTKTKLNGTLNLGIFSLGASGYYESKLADVTKSALEKAVSALVNATQMKEDKWYSRVMSNFDTALMIVGGADANIKVGDQFLIYNDDHFWDGVPCESTYRGGGSAANRAVAKIEISWVGDEISSGRVIEQNDFRPEIGARVQLYKMRAADYKEPEPGVEQPISNVVNEDPAT